MKDALGSAAVSAAHRHVGSKERSAGVSLPGYLPGHRNRGLIGLDRDTHHLRLPNSGCPNPFRVRLHQSLAGSPKLKAETGFSSCGLSIHLLLLPTPPHGDAVTVDYKF